MGTRGGSIFRINRDIRFSSDKRPYKDHLDFWFWEGDRKSAVSGLFLRVWPDGVVVGAGAHGFDKGQLEAYRDAVGHTTTGAELAAIVDELEAAGHEIGGETYKRVPRGYAADGIGERLLRHSALYVHAELPLPPQRGSSIPRWVIGALSVASTAGLSPMSRGRPGVLSARVHSGQRVNSSPFGP